MIEKNLIILLSLIYLATFISRNLLVKRQTNRKIRSADPLVTSSIVFTTLCVFTIICSANSDSWYQQLGPISLLRHPAASLIGLFLFAVSIPLGWIFSGQLQTSWRIGVHENQKTELIQNGIYIYVRNPYFLSYFVMFLGLFLIRPSIVMMLLVCCSVIIFHLMVLKEEAHLGRVHGKEYEKYKQSTGRYLPRLMK